MDLLTEGKIRTITRLRVTGNEGTQERAHRNTRRNAWQNGYAAQGNASEMHWERTEKVRENA